MSQLSLFEDKGGVTPFRPLSSMSKIYRPGGRALEYAPWACNVYRGCAHGCAYCYAPSACRLDRATFQNPVPRAGDFLAQVERDAETMAMNHIVGPVLLSFTCDPYQPIDVDMTMTRAVIEILHEHSIGVQFLTKGGLAAVRDLDLFRRRHRWDAAAATLTFTDPEDSARWEPNAAPPADRIEMLRLYHEAGVRTWVSCEPVIYPEQTLQAIRQAAPYVDEFRLGGTNHKGNFPPGLRAIVERIPWPTYTRAAVALCEELDVAYYVKEDLRPYLDKNAAK